MLCVMSYEAKLKEMGYTLEKVNLDGGRLMFAVRSGNLVYTSGHTSRWGGKEIKGRVGTDVTVDQAYEGARFCTLGCLSAIHSLCGIDKVVRIVKVLGMVNVAPDFFDTPSVIHGCSDLLREAFGEAGRHARSAVGMTIPANYSVEVELVAEVKD